MVNIRVFSTPGCANCSLLKNFLKENNLSFEEINVAADREKAKEMVEKTGQMSVPVTQIGEKFVIGNNKEEIIKSIEEAQ